MVQSLVINEHFKVTTLEAYSDYTIVQYYNIIRSQSENINLITEITNSIIRNMLFNIVSKYSYYYQNRMKVLWRQSPNDSGGRN